MIVYGGFDGSSSLNDVWVLSLAGTPTWTELSPDGPPPSTRNGQATIYDPVRDRMVMFGGGFGGSGGTYLNDVWALSLTGMPAWAALAPEGALPPGRKHHTVIYDPLRGEMVAFGGEDAGYFLRNDVRTLTWTDVPTAVLISLERAEAKNGVVHLSWFAPQGAGLIASVYRRHDRGVWQAIAAISPGGGRLVHDDTDVSAGNRYGYRLGVTEGSEEHFYGEVWVDVPGAPTLHLQGVRPNPGRGDLAVSFSLPNAAPATLEVFEVTGRRVFMQEVGSMGAGGHLVSIGRAPWLQSGVYLLRLSQGDRFLTTRVTLLK